MKKFEIRSCKVEIKQSKNGYFNPHITDEDVVSAILSDEYVVEGQFDNYDDAKKIYEKHHVGTAAKMSYVNTYFLVNGYYVVSYDVDDDGEELGETEEVIDLMHDHIVSPIQD